MKTAKKNPEKKLGLKKGKEVPGKKSEEKIRCDYYTCNAEAVAHHAHSHTNLCEHHFQVNEAAFGIKFTRKPVIRTYKSRPFAKEAVKP